MTATSPSTGKWTLETKNVESFSEQWPKNNHLEGWHYRLKGLAKKAHPNPFETIELIKNEQISTEVQMIQLAAGGQPRPKKEKKLLDTISKSKDLLQSLAMEKVNTGSISFSTG